MPIPAGRCSFPNQYTMVPAENLFEVRMKTAYMQVLMCSSWKYSYDILLLQYSNYGLFQNINMLLI